MINLAISNVSRLKMSRKINKISTIIKTAGNFGLLIDKEAIKKKFAETDDPRLELSEYDLMSTYASSIDPRYKKSAKDIMQSFYRDARFRYFLLEQSLQPELEEILDTLSNEAVIVNDHSNYFCQPRFDKTELPDLKDNITDEIEKKLNDIYPKIYRMLNFKANGAWKRFKEHLIIGPIAYEIVYDDLKNPKDIIGILPIDALTIREYWHEGERFWIQQPKFAVKGSQARLLHDSQVIMVEWENAWGRLSYLHRLIRPFNIARIMERTKINWFVLNSMFRTQHTIPVHGKSRAKAARTLSAAMNRYRDDIEFNDVEGTITVNGNPNIPSNKEYWLSDSEAGKPEIATIDSNGPDLQSMENIDFFDKRLYRASKIPVDRFDPANPETWHMDATSQKRQEINYSNFVNRVRDNFAQILLKPLIIQLCLEMPEIVNDFQVIDAIKLEYNKYNIFDELADMEVMTKKMDFCEQMINKFQYTDGQGQTYNYFPVNYVVEKYLNLSTEEIEKIEQYRKSESKWKLDRERESLVRAKKVEEIQKEIKPDEETDTETGTGDDTGGEGGDDNPGGGESAPTGDEGTGGESAGTEGDDDPSIASEENPETGDETSDAVLSA